MFVRSGDYWKVRLIANFELPIANLAVIVFLLCYATAAAGQTPRISLEPFASGLSAPVLVTNAKDGTNRRFIVEQPGRIRVIQPGSTVPTIFLDITTRVLYAGERGLLGLAFHPAFASNGRFYINYTRRP